MRVRAFPVRLPSGVRYWTVLDENLAVVSEADAFWRHVRFGRDGSELTTRSYAGGIALFLRWCSRTGRHWHVGVEHLGLFMTWLRHAGPQVSGTDVVPGVGGAVLLGPGREPVRGARRVNAVLTAVRGFVVHAVTSGQAPGALLPLLYELADDRDLPEQARGEDGRMAWRMRARHRLHEPETPVDRASDEEIVALLRACRSAEGCAKSDVAGYLLVRVGRPLGTLRPHRPLGGCPGCYRSSRTSRCAAPCRRSCCSPAATPPKTLRSWCSATNSPSCAARPHDQGSS